MENGAKYYDCKEIGNVKIIYVDPQQVYKKQLKCSF